MHLDNKIKSKTFLPFLFVLVVSCTASTKEVEKDAKQEPPFPLSLLASRPLPPSPADAAADWLLAHIDVETTGLVPGYHEMIDIGLVLTDLSGQIVDSLFLRIQPRHPERTSPIAREINAYDPARWEALGALTPDAAVDSLLAFHRKVAGDRPTMMVAFNAHFDLSFLDHLFREAGHTWREMYHYFVLDIPSMGWSLGYQDLTLQGFREEFGIEDEPHVAELHTGISGALKNVRIYRAMMERLQ